MRLEKQFVVVQRRVASGRSRTWRRAAVHEQPHELRAGPELQRNAVQNRLVGLWVQPGAVDRVLERAKERVKRRDGAVRLPGLPQQPAASASSRCARVRARCQRRREPAGVPRSLCLAHPAARRRPVSRRAATHVTLLRLRRPCPRAASSECGSAAHSETLAAVATPWQHPGLKLWAVRRWPADASCQAHTLPKMYGVCICAFLTPRKLGGPAHPPPVHAAPHKIHA